MQPIIGLRLGFVVVLFILAAAYFTQGCSLQAAPALATCHNASYEAGGDLTVCGRSAVNPIVVECDQTPTADDLAAQVGEGVVCKPGAKPGTACCEPEPAPDCYITVAEKALYPYCGPPRASLVGATCRIDGENHNSPCPTNCVEVSPLTLVCEL